MILCLMEKKKKRMGDEPVYNMIHICFLNTKGRGREGKKRKKEEERERGRGGEGRGKEQRTSSAGAEVPLAM